MINIIIPPTSFVTLVYFVVMPVICKVSMAMRKMKRSSIMKKRIYNKIYE